MLLFILTAGLFGPLVLIAVYVASTVVSGALIGKVNEIYVYVAVILVDIVLARSLDTALTNFLEHT